MMNFRYDPENYDLDPLYDAEDEDTTPDWEDDYDPEEAVS